MTAVSRRAFLSSALVLPVVQQTSSARFVATLPLGNPGGAAPPPFGRLLGDGLDARLFTDVSKISNQQSAINTGEFFVRTAAPKTLPAGPWTVAVSGLVDAPQTLTIAQLEPLGSHSGRYLLECSGNSDPGNFGLLSTADWDGVPLAALLDHVK